MSEPSKPKLGAYRPKPSLPPPAARAIATAFFAPAIAPHRPYDKELHLAPGKSSDRYAVAIHNSISGERRHSKSRCQDPDEIEWICT
jgi:hypothetical protein